MNDAAPSTVLAAAGTVVAFVVGSVLAVAVHIPRS